MNEAREPGENEEADGRYLRLPWRALALGLCGLLVALLAVGLYANRYLRPQIGRVATPVVAPIVAAAPPSSTPTAVPAAVLSASPTSLSNPSPSPSGSPSLSSSPAASLSAPALRDPSARVNDTPVPRAAVSPTPSPTPSPAPPGQTARPSALPTVEPALADEVGRAYVEFWRVRSQALLELDPTHLPEVMDGDYLTRIQSLIDQLRSEGHAIKTQVSLNYSVLQATPDMALVVDDLTDDSVYVAIGTEDPLTAPPRDQLRVLYTLRPISGVWKVVDSVRSE